MSYDDSVLLVQMASDESSQHGGAVGGGERWQPQRGKPIRARLVSWSALLSRHRFGRSGPFMNPLAGIG